LDGTAQRRLTNTGYMLYSSNPRFSPNGQQIVYSRFTGYRMGGPGYTDVEVRVMKFDGKNDRRLVGDLSNSDQNHFDPFWSLDGQNILFTRTIGCIDYRGEGWVKFEQRIIGADGRNEREFNSEWSKFGSVLSPADKLRFAANVAKGATVGSVLRSKDGKQIVFEVSQQQKTKTVDGLINNERSTEIWRSDSNGSNTRRVTGANSYLLGWFP
jgi:Tol biopolymer transport system component